LKINFNDGLFAKSNAIKWAPRFLSLQIANQGILIAREYSVPLTSFYQIVQMRCFYTEKNIFVLYKTGY
jgi:hypothetical protein